jgi:hypothetical protein
MMVKNKKIRITGKKKISESFIRGKFEIKKIGNGFIGVPSKHFIEFVVENFCLHKQYLIVKNTIRVCNEMVVQGIRFFGGNVSQSSVQGLRLLFGNYHGLVKLPINRYAKTDSLKLDCMVKK